ncbi:hypothetical protein [Elizabethkingia anophelis]|uniref:hypothetical protein n=1 Tax=Elizabethkingia anophelis TaxID=1117645 RepID=UPI00320B7885
MQNKKLITLMDFVLNINEIVPEVNNFKKLVSIENYAKFLKERINLGMFFPCDKHGNLLKKPNNYELWKALHEEEGSTIGFIEHEEYLEASNKVFFEDFYVGSDIWPGRESQIALYHKSRKYPVAEITPEFIWNRTNEFTLEDITIHSPYKDIYTLTPAAINKFLLKTI